MSQYFNSDIERNCRRNIIDNHQIPWQTVFDQCIHSAERTCIYQQNHSSSSRNIFQITPYFINHRIKRRVHRHINCFKHKGSTCLIHHFCNTARRCISMRSNQTCQFNRLYNILMQSNCKQKQDVFSTALFQRYHFLKKTFCNIMCPWKRLFKINRQFPLHLCIQFHLREHLITQVQFLQTLVCHTNSIAFQHQSAAALKHLSYRIFEHRRTHCDIFLPSLHLVFIP